MLCWFVVACWFDGAVHLRFGVFTWGVGGWPIAVLVAMANV